MRSGRVLVAVVLVVVLLSPGAAPGGQRLPSDRAELVELGVPATVDTSNQAGWWTPIVVHRGAVYYAYDAPARTPGSHVVRVAKRLPSGLTESSCLTIDGRCATYVDDAGHHQPSLAVDGDGYVHVFVAMHLSPWHGRYFRSTEPNSVTTFAEQSRTLPDPAWTHTYPVLATAPDGDVWLTIRSRSSPGSHGVGGRIYHYDRAHRAWTRTATFAYNPGLWVYTDDLQIDASGRLHIAFEWVKKRVGWFPHIGAYVTYDPATGRLANAAGQVLDGPLTVHSPAAYQWWASSFDPAARGNGFGVQTAKLALDPATGRPQIAYRYQAGYHRRPSVLVAGWDGTRWRRTTVYGGRYDTFPTVDVTMVGTSLRVYYAKVNTSGGPSAFLAERTAAGSYAERSLAPAHPGIERLSAVAGDDGTDVVYLSAPRAGAGGPRSGELYVGTLAR